jgi:predicted TIM-barrel fold metal-dependent hydrolase
MAPNPEPTPSKANRALSALSATFVIAALGLLGWSLLARQGVVESPQSVAQKAVIQGLPLIKTKNVKAYLETDDPTETIESLAPRKHKVVNVHEHVLDEKEMTRLMHVMDQLGVQRTCVLAATTYTFTLNNKYGFEGFKENNEEVIRLKKKFPDRICAFVTLDPVEDGNLERMKDYAARGADGLKLYLGHGAATGKGPFHVMPLDDPRMDPIWAWAEETQFPVTMHVNLIKYWDEFLNVMEKHPYLRMNIPHFGLHKNTGNRLKRLSFLLKRYPNLYTDMSYGYYTFHVEGFEALSKWRSRSKEFILEHRDRILFASDMVLEPTKDEPYMLNTLRSYMQWLERDRFRFFYIPDRTMHGMGMDPETLRIIYEQAPNTFLLADENGMMRDRSSGAPAGAPPLVKTPLPPLDKSLIPPDGPSKPGSAPATKQSPGEGPESADDDKGAGCEHEPWEDE